MTLAYSADTWTEVIVGMSIFVPVVITAALAIVFMRRSKGDPDRERLKRVQAEYEAQQDHPERRRR